MEKTRVKVDQTDVELKETQTKVEKTRAKVDQTDSDLKDTQTKVEKTRVKIDQTDVELKETQTKVEKTNIVLKGAKKDISLFGLSSKKPKFGFTQLESSEETFDIIQLNRVVGSFKAFEKSINNINYLNILIDDNIDKIKIDYSTILAPIVEQKFIENGNHFWIFQCNDIDDIDNNKCYFKWKNLKEWNNKSIKDIYTDTNYSSYESILKKSIKEDIDILKTLKDKNPGKNLYHNIFISEWENNLILKFTLYRQDLLLKNGWMTISSSINLSDYISDININDMSTFSSQYQIFTQYISNIMQNFNNPEWILENVGDVWQYDNPSNFLKSKCISSYSHPEWNNQFIKNCFVPGDEIDNPKILLDVITNLYNSYRYILTPSQIYTVIYNNNNIFCLSVCKIGKDGNTFQKYDIIINDFFVNTINFNNDMSLIGSLQVKTYNNKNIMNSDTTLNVTTFHDKVGINQDPHEVKGLLDIDNLSSSMILDLIINNFSSKLLYSYNVSNSIKDNISFGNSSIDKSLFLEYINDVIIFKIPLKNEINKTDISFIHNITNYFSSFSEKSVIVLKNIINEIHKMSLTTPEIDFAKNVNQKNYIFSFLELLNDEKYNFLCSLKGLLISNTDNSQMEIYFVMSFNNINSVMIDNSYNKLFDIIIKKISSCQRLLNYSILLIYNPVIYNNLNNKLSIGTDCFSTVIENSKDFSDRFGSDELYTFGYSMDNGYMYFNELYPEWNGKDTELLFLPNKDHKISEIATKIKTSYKYLYGDKYNQTFNLSYYWNNDIKLSFVNIITIEGKKYLIGTGIDLYDYLNLSILLKGDSEYTGNLKIIDNKKNTIFQIDESKKQILNMYKVGIGTKNPETTLDINDSSLGDIINVINNMADQFNTLNKNINNFRNISDESEIKNIIMSNFIDPKTGTQIIQNEDNYLVSAKNSKALNVKDHTYTFNWLYPDWEGIKIGEIIDDNNKESINNMINIGIPSFLNNMFFDYGLNIVTFPFVYGIRVVIVYNFLFKDNIETIAQGVNLQSFDLKYNNNENIQKFFYNIEAYSFYLQDFVARYKKIEMQNIINYKKAQDIKNKNLQSFPIQYFKKYIIDTTNINKTEICDINFDDSTESNNYIYSEIEDVNLRNKIILFVSNINTVYKTFKQDDYGIVHFEDNYNDFMSLFYCSEFKDNKITLFSLELQLNTIILPTQKVHGDVKITGDLYLNNSDNNNFVLIDTENKYFGVNTQEIYVNYLDNYTTTTNSSFTKQNMIVKSEKYPLLVLERVNENKSDLSNNNYFNFKNFSTLTARRTSELYNFSEMLKYSSEYKTRTKLPNAFGINKEDNYYHNKYHYGADLTFEVKDKYNIIKEIGNISIGIDDITQNGEIKGGFSVCVVDTDKTENPLERQILYVDNKSVLYVNEIMLGGFLLKSDTDGNLLFNGRKVKFED